MTYSDGSRYDGEWKDDKESGRGCSEGVMEFAMTWSGKTVT